MNLLALNLLEEKDNLNKRVYKMQKYKKYINIPEIRGASELLYHKEGQGTRYVFLDKSVVPDSNVYVIVRKVTNVQEDKKSHVDLHAHNCDSAFLFIGSSNDLSGLVCEINLGDEKYKIESPASVFIPRGLQHSYRFISGSGHYVNLVLSGDYNKSIL